MPRFVVDKNISDSFDISGLVSELNSIVCLYNEGILSNDEFEALFETSFYNNAKIDEVNAAIDEQLKSVVSMERIGDRFISVIQGQMEETARKLDSLESDSSLSDFG